jgi:hypothetical protein
MDSVNDNDRTPSEGEIFYDFEIAPVLMELSRRCESRGMGFVASVEFQPGGNATTANAPAQESINGLLVLWASRSAGNLDKLALAVARHVKETGMPHSSVVLQAMGVPFTPEDDGKLQD